MDNFNQDDNTKNKAVRASTQTAFNSKDHTSNNTSNSSEAQRARLLEHLKQFGSATTIELRRDLDVMMPAARVHELRHKFGHNITMAKVYQPTDCGKLHKVARYFLNDGAI
ncbi:MAG: helix-turn-helix domain-containing protein [Methylococcaceae bacterium]|nr:helix-turn-helix domain-containing protein [Methylococcaceae bacterium]